jgi:AAA+ ATPase superfamily predicted ATPase
MNSNFIGRREELEQLSRLKQKRYASLVCLLGRRRIGKSRMIEEFGREFPKFIEIQGLPPEEEAKLHDQLDHFSEELSIQLNVKKKRLDSWTAAFSYLAEQTRDGQCLVLLDEISWMAKGDPLFAARLKSAWDTKLKKNNELILVLCGSVSSWISDNILKNASFEGRVSLQIQLKELSLQEVNSYWDKNGYRLSTAEKLLILSITGGVPKYLEEISSSRGAEKSLIELCFSPAGILYNDFQKIFLDIFGRRSRTLESIVRSCLTQKLSPAELATKLDKQLSGELTECLNILELGGFISRDYYFKADGEASTLNHLRVSDNYLRFYLKYIEPRKKAISKGGKKYESMSELPGFESTVGLQFENLILTNRTLLYDKLDITQNQVISAAPYIQRKKSTNQGGCQIDLLIHSKLDVFYLCEIKYGKRIDRSIIKEVQKKMSVLQLPKRCALKPVLIYAGGLTADSEEQIRDFFFKIVEFEELLLNF